MKIFVVEDSALVRERLIEMLEADGLHAVVGEASTQDAAVEGITRSHPDVCIVDVRLARGNGLAALAEVKRRMPELVGIVLSNFANAQHARASREAGAYCFLDKSADFERIPEILATLTNSGHSRSCI